MGRRPMLAAVLVVLVLVVLFMVGQCVVGLVNSDRPLQVQTNLDNPAVGNDAVDDERKLNHIRLNEGAYPADLIAFAETYPQVIDFVYRYPENEGVVGEIDLSAEAASGEVPRLCQWDDRWGYAPYGDGVLGRYGCGPTCLSMVAIYLTGNPAYTPVFVAEYAESRGYYTYGVGSDWRLIAEGCAGFGLSSTEVPLGEASMVEQLDAGHPLICAVGPGDFTAVGHYVVLTGYSDGSFTLNDPNSVDNSNRTWTYDELSGQIEGIWAISRA